MSLPRSSPAWPNSALFPMPRSATPLSSFLRPALAFALFIAFLGFLPHALFSWNAGAWHYLSNAWDEDSYTGFALRHEDVIYRIVSASTLRHAIAWLGLDGGLIVMDVAIPFVAALVAAAIAWRAGFRTRRSFFLAGCLLLFALEFLALCNSSMIGMYVSQALPFSSLVYPDWIRVLVPSMYENFFSLYKSPEPQITFIAQFAAFYLLLRHAQTERAAYTVALALLALVFPFIYVSTAITLIFCMGLYAAAGLLLTRQRHYVPMLGCTLFAGVNYLYHFLGGNPVDGGGITFVFTSHWPILSVSMLWGGALFWLYARHWGRNLLTRAWARSLSAPMLLALVCATVPFVTLNQQVLTGQMVQSRTWEYYTNLPFTAFAILLFWPLIAQHLGPRVPGFLRARAHYAAPLLGLLLVVSQVTNFAKYSKGNLDNVAVAEMLGELRAQYPNGLPKLMLQNTGDDSQIALRLGQPDLLAVAGYQQTIKHPIARLTEASYEASAAPMREHAYAYFDRQGVSADELQQRMEDAASTAMGAVEVSYFFSYIDCWKPLSDYREQNVAGMKEKIPAIIAGYRTFLADAKRRNQFGELLYITRKPRPASGNPPWKETLLLSRTIGHYRPVTVYIYRQLPLKSAR